MDGFGCMIVVYIGNKQYEAFIAESVSCSLFTRSRYNIIAFGMDNWDETFRKSLQLKAMGMNYCEE